MADSSSRSVGSGHTMVPSQNSKPTTGHGDPDQSDYIRSFDSDRPHPDTQPSFKMGAAPAPAHHFPEFENYFSGPRDISRHSKWPLILRIHGSIVPKLVLPLLGIGLWSAAIVYIYEEVHDISVNFILLTILGFVVSLCLTFRCSTAYERYTEGRRCWGQLVLGSQALGRVIWLHVNDEGQPDSHELTIRKLTAMNLVVAFSVALKHALRFEPYSNYPDLKPLIGHLTVLAEESVTAEPDSIGPKRKSFFKSAGEHLGVSFAESNPRKLIKRASKPLGNLPLEILNYLSMSIDSFHANNQIRVFNHESIAYTQLTMLNDIMINTKRVLDTPLPIAYSIAISQITFVYVILLPFQLVNELGWVTIPATVAATYIIIGLLLIGQEIENPFGFDVNDLPLEEYCDQIAEDMDVVATLDKRDYQSIHLSTTNMPLYPVSKAPASAWALRDNARLDEAIKKKPRALFELRQQAANKDENSNKQS